MDQLWKQNDQTENLIQAFEKIPANVQISDVLASVSDDIVLAIRDMPYPHTVQDQYMNALECCLSFGKFIETNLLGLFGGEVHFLSNLDSIIGHVLLA